MGDNEFENKFYDKSNVDVLSVSLEKAFNSVGCNWACFDWLSYNPDFHIKEEMKKAA